MHLKPRSAVTTMMLISATMLVTVMVRIACGSSSEGLTINEIVENVRTNEGLYDALEVDIISAYRTMNQESHGTNEQTGSITATKADGEIHYVRQGDLYRVDRKGSITGEGTEHLTDRVRAFDGSTTRLYDQERIGNIAEGRVEDDDIIRPHMLLLQFMHFQAPLSVYLSGDQGMRAYPGVDWTPSHILEVSYHGSETLEEHTCHHVSITTVVNKKPNDRWDLWLAEDRNYLPLKIKGYTFRISDTKPVSEGGVSRFKEVQPGVWFPMHVDFVAYDQQKLRSGGAAEPSWRQEFTMSQVSLEPKHDLAYFQDVTFPKGTAVYHVKQGKIVQSYVEGAPGSPAESELQTKSSWRWGVIAVNVAIVVSLAVLLVRRVARRTA